MICAVIAFSGEDPSEKLNQAGATIYSRDYGHAYFVSYKGTARELADKLGFQEERMVEGVVLSIGAFAGYTDKDLWAWLREHRGND